MHKHTLPDGCQLAYEWEGPETGEPIVFLNGILMNLRAWKAQISPLRGRYRCLTHDFRGQLNSDKHFPGPATLAQHVEDLRHLLDALMVPQAQLVGTSYGGEVALLFAHRYPERVRSLCLIASVSYSDALLKRQVRLWRDLAGLSPELLYDAVATCSYSPAFLERHGSFLQSRRAAFAGLPEDFFLAFQQLCEAFLDFELQEAALAALNRPALIIAAGADLLKPPRYSLAMAAHLPNAQYEAIPHAGHAVVIEQPKAINHLFLPFVEKNGQK